MATKELTTREFPTTVSKQGIVLIDFWASWCGPCRMFAPIFEAASNKHPDITFAKVNTEAEPQLAQALQIQAIPTLMAFRDGYVVFAQAGMLPPKALDELIGKIKALDMNAIKAKLPKAVA